jgi:hypothetical protein
MLIRELVPHGGVLVEMNPDDCYTLADACRMAANELSELTSPNGANMREAHLYDTLMALLEGFALAGSAMGYMSPKDYDKYTVAGVRAAWRSASPVRGGGR